MSTVLEYVTSIILSADYSIQTIKTNGNKLVLQSLPIPVDPAGFWCAAGQPAGVVCAALAVAEFAAAAAVVAVATVAAETAAIAGAAVAGAAAVAVVAAVGLFAAVSVKFKRIHIKQAQ